MQHPLLILMLIFTIISGRSTTPPCQCKSIYEWDNIPFEILCWLPRLSCDICEKTKINYLWSSTTSAKRIDDSFHLIRTHNDSEIPVRLVGMKGEFLGIYSLKDALKEAKMRSLDLAQISKAVSPPVCKILDYGKFKYQKEKEQKIKLLRQRSQSLKEIQITFRISDNDLKIKCQNGARFLKAGNQVKFSLFLRGREKNHPELAENLFDKIADFLKEFGHSQKEIQIGGIIYRIFTPKRKSPQS